MIKKPENIKEYKDRLRKNLRTRRKELPPEKKALFDDLVFKNVISLKDFLDAEEILVYISTDIEVGTKQIVDFAFAHGKKVVVPRCIDNTRLMDFYYIENYDCLKERTYGIMEPNDDPIFLWDQDLNKKSICLIPALTCDRRGFRLGYGGGYYDRFLTKYCGKTLILMYEEFLIHHIWEGKFDVNSDNIVTDSKVYDCLLQK